MGDPAAVMHEPGAAQDPASLKLDRPDITAWLAGIDNLLDRACVEHIQRLSADLGASSRRIFEPGRTLWLRLGTKF